MVEIPFVQVVYSIFLSFLHSRPSWGRRVEDYLTCYALSRATSSITCWVISTSISPPICTSFFIEIVLKVYQPSTTKQRAIYHQILQSAQSICQHGRVLMLNLRTIRPCLRQELQLLHCMSLLCLFCPSSTC
jgi:hypothetical protein